MYLLFFIIFFLGLSEYILMKFEHTSMNFLFFFVWIFFLSAAKYIIMINSCSKQTASLYLLDIILIPSNMTQYFIIYIFIFFITLTLTPSFFILFSKIVQPFIIILIIVF